MSLVQKPPSLHIDPNDPFKADCFGLEEFATALTQVIANSSEAFVVNLEAPWGQGKTTFLEMWRHSLKKRGIESLYFNAWENDFSGSALVALIGELGEGIAALRLGEKSRAAKQLEKLKKIGARVAVHALPALVKAGTFGAVDLSDAVEEALADASEKIAEGEIRRYQEAKASIAEFREELSKFAKQIGGEESANPLVIIIDELDRCRPDYSISILETVKHLFAVPGVVFIIATDSRQLSNAIRHVYGLDAAAEDYLRRFFDLSISLPTPSTKQFAEALYTRHGLDSFFKQRAQHHELQYDREQAMAALVAMFNAMDCSLRDQQKMLHPPYDIAPKS